MRKNNTHNYTVIMAGGSGTRLWPLSRKDLPKQMQKFISDKTLINETVDRLIDIVDPKNILITTTANYEEKIRSLLPNIAPENIIVEPVSRGTTAALALAATVIYRRDENASIFYVASDHAITEIKKFQKTVLNTFVYVEENKQDIVLVGIKPTRPDTGLGYIKLKKNLQEKPIRVFTVEKFVEKPGLRVAKQYLASGQYYWNAAYYCFKAKTLLEAYYDADPEITHWIDKFLLSKDLNDFNKVPVKAHEIEVIDSKKYRLVLVTADFDWSDIGNWRSLHEILANINGNSMVASSNRHVDINSENCLIISTEEKLVATVGLKNVVIVNTPDVLLVLNEDQTQEVKKLLEELKKHGLSEYL